MKKELVDLIRNRDLKKALEKGESFLKTINDHYYTWTMLQSRYSDIRNKNTHGVLSHEDHTSGLNQINAALLDLVLKIDQDIRLNFQENKLETKTLKDRLQDKLVTNYTILDIISEGNSTITYKIQERFGDDFFALRALKNDNLYKTTEAFDEVDKVKKINHRNIISLFGKSSKKSIPRYVIMEYVGGIDLETLILENGPRPIGETKRILLRICDALYYLHKRKIFNADLRASRILIDGEGEPMLSPFIVFRTKSENNYDQIISNLKYMSYQRLNSKDYKHYTPQSNQFSLGVLTYLLLVGETLFDSDSIIDLIEDRSAFEKKEAFRNEKLDKIEGPKELIEIVKKLLSKKRNHRFSSMLEVITAINSVVDESSEHQQIAQESYSRACSCYPQITFDLVEKINDEDINNLPDLDKNKFALKLHNTINLIIETNSHRSYLIKVMKSKVLSTLFIHNFEQFKEILFDLLDNYDYLWTEDIKIAWDNTLNETFQRVKDRVDVK